MQLLPKGHARRAAGIGALGLVLAASCARNGPATVAGAPATSSMPAARWTPPARAVRPLPEPVAPDSEAGRLAALGLADVVDLSLRHNPQTIAAWRTARAAAAGVGAAWAAYLPAIDAEISGGPSKVVSSSPGRLPSNRLTYGPSLSLAWLLLDAGGRGGAIESARQALFAADFAHNATLQDVMLQAESAFFAFQTARELLAAQGASLETSRANLAAAQQRHDVGLATIADVLQARTALAQAELALQDAEGGAQTARANLALVLGIDANTPFEVAADPPRAPIADVAESVDSLIARAALERPDIAQARAEARGADAEVRVARSGVWPALSLTASAGRTYSDTSVLGGSTYSLSFGLAIPLTTGLTRRYSVAAAREQAAAFRARYEDVRVRAAAQVFTAYYALRTSTQRVSTSGRLLASAEESEGVASGRYKEGVGTILDLLTAQSALADARRQQVQARWAWYAALAQLAHDVGILGPHGEAPVRLTPDSTRGSR